MPEETSDIGCEDPRVSALTEKLRAAIASNGMKGWESRDKLHMDTGKFVFRRFLQIFVDSIFFLEAGAVCAQISAPSAP